MALIKEYFELTDKYIQEYGENTVLLMLVGSFFEVYGYKDNFGNIYGSKIIEFSQIGELNVVDKCVCVEKKTIVMAGFKDFMIEKYLKKLQEAGYTVVVYKQDEATKNTTRSLEGIYSPGTYFSNESVKLTNNITCVWINIIDNKFTNGKVVVVGMVNIDIYTGKSNMFEYKEKYFNNPTTFDELERFISIYNPSEFIIISNLSDNDINDVINYANVKSSLIHIINTQTQNKTEKIVRVKNCEKQTYQKEILNKFYKIDNFDVFFQNFYNNTIATQAFCFLLDFIYQHNSHLVYKINEPQFDNFSDRLVLANHSLKQLNIINDDNYNGKYSSVLKMLNGCLTPMGKRKFIQSFLNPTTNESFLQKEYDIIEYILSNFENYNIFFSQKLKDIKDISKWERQIFIKKISPKSFYNLFKNLEVIDKVFDKIQNDHTILTYLNNNKDTTNIKNSCFELNEFINKYLNLNISKDIDQIQQFDLNFFNSGIDKDLDEKTKIIIESEKKLEAIKNYLNDLIKFKEKKNKTNDYIKFHETEKNSINLITTNRRCKLLEDVLPLNETIIKLTYINVIQNENQEVEFDFTIKKGIFDYVKQSVSNIFINNSQINNLCKNITSTKVSMKNQILFVYNKFVESFGEKFQKQLENIIEFITNIDMIYGKSTISKKYNYCKPNIKPADKSFVEAKNIRHCLIELLQNNEFYVTNDITIGTGILDGILLYGTNAVGKTSLIKALGIAIIMAQSGLYVPCSEFNFKPYKYIFTRILGNDNIFKGLSTFAVEMSELRTILRLANENSLILGDELCSGTEITSAISIFVAGICKLSIQKASYIFATHLHEISNYEEITNITNLKLKHMSVVYDKENDCLVYDRKLKDGTGNSMYGLEVCKSLNLPDDFLEKAYDIRMKYNPESASILSLKQSHFNVKKIVGICEKCCVNMSTEVHHLTHQSNADEKGFIDIYGYKVHKNNVANLLSLCEKCHNEFHKIGKDKKVKQYKKVKTTKGLILQEN